MRVHPEILRGQSLPEELRDEKTIWGQRYRSIRDLESHLYRNGTRTVKIFLHLSKEEQRKRFLERIDERNKNWKFSSADIHERRYWEHYMEAYEACLKATSTHHAPWYVVPADDKENARLAVSHIVLHSLSELKTPFPRPVEFKADVAELESFLNELEARQSKAEKARKILQKPPGVSVGALG